MMLTAQLTQGRLSEVTTQLAMVMLVAYVLTGLALIHGLIRRYGRSTGWLVATYLLLSFVPQTTLLLAATGLLDTWVDLRRRLGRAGRGQ